MDDESGMVWIDQVDDWRLPLEKNPHLSPRFRARYSVVLARLQSAAAPGSQQAARIEAQICPRRAARLLVDLPILSVPAPRADSSCALRDLLRGIPDVERYLAEAPRLLQTLVPLHPSREARLLPGGAAFPQGVVALRWQADSVEARRANQRIVRDLVSSLDLPGDLRIAVQEECELVNTGPDRDPWALAPNLGTTLEDQLRGTELAPGRRAKVLEGLRVMRRAMLEVGRVWQGFAPRNMFVHDNTVILIDFEEVVDAAQRPERAAECLRWHRVFFADCLTAAEQHRLFEVDGAFPEPSDDLLLDADRFEQALLGAETVSWRQRRELLEQSAALEGRHLRPRCGHDEEFLFGHELGHFWGDFLPAETEAEIFRVLARVADPAILAACMEAFEAAMEADICRMLTKEALGENESENGAARTETLTTCLAAAGPGAMAARRMAIADWYERLVIDPGWLVDELILALESRPEGLDNKQLGGLLVGSGADRSEHEDTLRDTLRVGLDFLHRAEDGEPFLHHAEPAELLANVGGPLPVAGVEMREVLDEVEEVIAKYSISQSHPGYLAFPDSGNAVAAVAGNILSPLLNQNLIAVDRSAPVATFIEIQVIEWLRELLGYPSAPLDRLRGLKDVAGLWTTGGHLSNHIAMLVALGQAFPEARKRGLRALSTQPAVVMAGPIAHYSHSDAAFHLGLGWDSVISVEAASDFTTDPQAVANALANPPDGLTPFVVVGVAGNCRTTGLDDLRAIGEICRESGVWFHVDACHGGSLIFSEEMRERHLVGIELADSVSLDPHKGLFTPYPSSYVVFRDRGMLTHFSRHEATVLRDDCWDLGLITPFLGSRGFESLATWMLLRHLGVARLGALVDGRNALIHYLDRRIADTGLFVRLNDVDFYRLSFVLCPPAVSAGLRRLPATDRARVARLISRYTAELNAQLYTSGQVCFDEHTLADLDDRVGAGAGTGYTIMAACPGNPLLTREHLDRAVGRLLAAAYPLAHQLTADLVARGWADEGVEPGVSGPAGWNDVPR
ncbi:pyridoxal phosphate-dependent decarboxylase family protein [Actinomadura sp. 6N118]|uniref:pyridoxal phosphate-dependent decarboxylase family protein n=1 Tax=Actinomadura sp. 6N118 TaxID=3375151 RepID=UPI0037939A4C